MYQDNAFSSGEVDRAIGEARSGSTSAQQLRSVMAELLIALSSALSDEHSSAEESLRRAVAVLQNMEQPRAPAIQPLKGGLAPWQIRKVTAHIETNLDTPICNRDLAAVARLSEFHFNVAFRRSVGQSPHEHIIRRRMERAQGLMLSTNKALSEIAGECGLADQSHLTRLFRRVVGESPAAWRRARANPL